MKERYDFIKSIYNITEADYQLFTRDLKTATFKKGEHITMPGQTAKKIFLVRNGVQMYYYDAGDRPSVLGFTYCPHFSVILESFLYQKPSKYYLTCVVDSELDYLTFESLQQLFEESQQIERLFRKLLEAVSVGLINRQIELRSTTIEERFRAFCQRSPHLLQLVPHKFIASYLAIDPTNFSKLFNKVKI
ncbi:MAG: Crp/Fnr family transcriptional regulator [Sphingobacteriales bacterium]|nr:MAG: Crp/Fnr family transcriptional regulator [Sphingobacteriales bacterium]